MSTSPIYAQWSVELGYGARSLDIKDGLLSPFTFEGNSNSGLYGAVNYSIENSRFGIQYTQIETRTHPNEDLEGLFTTNQLQAYYYSIDLYYLREIIPDWRSFSLLVGIQNSTHLSYNELSYENEFLTAFYRSHEFAIINALVKFEVRKSLGRHYLGNSTGASVFNFASRSDDVENTVDFNFKGNFFSNFFELHNDFFVQLNVTETLGIKANYSVEYFTYSEPERLKYLTQTLAIGVNYHF